MGRLVPGKKYIYSEYSILGKLKSTAVVTYVGSDRDNEMFRTRNFKEILVPYEKLHKHIEVYPEDYKYVNRYRNRRNKEDNDGRLC